ncbi:nucleolar protein NOP58 [Pseudozyma hubeiensis SY62]|uniref:Nucleolar protein NOP58 n=1 Tax=Pseudozyma hubeiensis (strain SY62) TaxID=1305764 RepID=R9P7F4_PSEHS|nr:nucleolar protein NOP58 [Pseudozyma hubeiensis SY62]GAC97281.1 nucleolar protein NOP58 [Pseudozyma hubeiensis SY62]
MRGLHPSGVRAELERRGKTIKASGHARSGGSRFLALFGTAARNGTKSRFYAFEPSPRGEKGQFEMHRGRTLQEKSGFKFFDARAETEKVVDDEPQEEKEHKLALGLLFSFLQ